MRDIKRAAKEALAGLVFFLSLAVMVISIFLS